MANDPLDSFEKQLNPLSDLFKRDLLNGINEYRWPERIDYVASKIAEDGGYTVGLGTNSGPEQISSGHRLDEAASKHYLDGIVKLTDDHSRRTTLSDNFRLGELLVQFSSLRYGLEETETDVPPGEILGRLITRNVKRSSTSDQIQAAQELHPESETPRELVSELTAVPEIADLINSALPNNSGEKTLSEQLAEIDLTTQLWEHQREALQEWLRNDMHGYVDMATATGKTVLGLAAAAYMVDSGSLHPDDRETLKQSFDGELPQPDRSRPDDVLIVTTDDLLGVQWARLFREHCHTPPEYTQVKDNSIKLPWGTVEIRSAAGINGLDASDYRLAIFDEVHNYSSESGWGEGLTEFIESSCPVLALTGSVTEEFESRVTQADKHLPRVGDRYTLADAREDGIIPDFSWTLTFTNVTNDGNLSKLKRSATAIPQIVTYETDQIRVKPSDIESIEPDLRPNIRKEIEGTYETGSKLASTLRDIDDGPEAPTESLEQVATGINNRSIYRLNLNTETTIIKKIARDALAQERPVLILTRSYDEAHHLWQELYQGNDDQKIIELKQNQSAKEQDNCIQRFDEAETDKKALIAPGKRIGEGNDIQSVEVGINIARPGSGANPTLIQRLGRLLRKSSGKDSVKFYHVLGVQPEASVLPPDGESFVTNMAGFFGQVLVPDTKGILKPPSVRIDSEDVGHSISVLEHAGAPRVEANRTPTNIEEAYIEAIKSAPKHSTDPVVGGDWFEKAFDIEIPQQSDESVPGDSVADGQENVEHTEIDETGNNGTGDSTAQSNDKEESMNDNQQTSVSATDAESGSEPNGGYTVSIDPGLIALIDSVVDDPSSEYDNRDELIRTSIESLLEKTITGETTPEFFTTTSKRDIDLSADPTLEMLLERTIKSSATVESIDDLVADALYSYVGIDPTKDELCVSNFGEYRFVINKIIKTDHYPCETPGEVVQAAIENHFNI